MADSNPSSCLFCGAVNARCRCRRCGGKYCGRDCQHSDWPEHKLTCRSRSSAPSSSSSPPAPPTSTAAAHQPKADAEPPEPATPSTAAAYDPQDYQNPHPADAPGGRGEGSSTTAKGKDKGTGKDKKDVRFCFHRACQKAHAPRTCKQCRLAFYCNRQCQHDDWRRHKPVCTAAVAEAARRATAAREAREGGGVSNEQCVICIGAVVEPVEVR